MAEGAGFEPAVGLPTTAFKAVPIGRSGTPPCPWTDRWATWEQYPESRPGRRGQSPHRPAAPAEGTVGLNGGVVTDYRLAAPLAARVVGACFSVLAVCVFGSTFLVAALGGAFYWVAVVAVTGVVITGLIAYAVGVALPCLRLDDAGYRVAILRGVGARRGLWTDVREVAEQTAGPVRVLVLRLANGSSTRLSLATLRAEPAQVIAEVRRRVSAGHDGAPG